MRVRMLSTAAGPSGVWAQHSVQTLPDAVALELVRTGHAILVASTSSASTSSANFEVPETPEAGMTPEEQAILAPVETTGSRRGKRRSS